MISPASRGPSQSAFDSIDIVQMINSGVPACPVRSEPRMYTRVLGRRPWQIVLVSVFALLLGGPLMTAHQSSAQDQPRPTFRTEANYIRVDVRSEEHTSELQSRLHLVCRLLLEKK